METGYTLDGYDCPSCEGEGCEDCETEADEEE